MAEKTYYDRNGVQVTNARAVMAGKTFAMSNITSVSMATLPHKASGCVTLLMAAGVIVAVMTLLLLDNKGPMLILALLIAGAGFAAYKTLKPNYAVRIGSSSGEAEGLTSQNRSEIETIVSAMNQAIVERG